APRRRRRRSTRARPRRCAMREDFGGQLDCADQNAVAPERRETGPSLEAVNSVPPAAPTTETVVRKGRARRGASRAVTASRGLPHAATESEIGGLAAAADQGAPAPIGEGVAPLADTINQSIINRLIELQRQRVFCIKSQSRCDRSAEAFIARFIGYRADMPKAERDAIW